jgi:hypothetical protein
MPSNPHQNTQALQAFHKAKVLAYWSLSGLVVPFAGIILGVISLSRLTVLTPGNDEEYWTIQRVRRFAWSGIGLSVTVTILTIAGGIYLVTRSSPAASSNSSTASSSAPTTVSGSLSLHDPDSFSGLSSGTACEGSNGYNDITQGAQVTVSDNSGSILAVSSSGMSAGTADGSGNCVFSFTIDNVPYSQFYQFQVSHRGQLAYSYQQLSSDNFQIATTLGN